MKIVVDKFFQEEHISEVFNNPGPNIKGTRTLKDNISDLKAQIAANNRGIILLQNLIEEYSLKYVQKYMFFIQENAQKCVQEMLCQISRTNNMKEIDSVMEHDFMDDGTKIALKLTIDRKNKTANFDFNGSGFQVFNNTNCPKAVTKSAIIYCLRCLVNQEIPLNQGFYIFSFSEIYYFFFFFIKDV